jgi:DNA-binding NarL/FixJ family response regulator
MKAKTKILVVDDHAVFRDGLVRIINQESDLSVCAQASDGAEAIKQYETHKPDAVIMDISMDGMNGIDLARLMRTRFPSARLLVLSMHKESTYAERALRAGANGYIMKKESGRQLIDALRRVISGQTFVSDQLNELLLQKLAHPNRKLGLFSIDLLSDRQLEVFRLIGQGYGTRQIADELHISMKTVESHREHIRTKLNLNTTFELVQQAIHWMRSEDAPAIP